MVTCSKVHSVCSLHLAGFSSQHYEASGGEDVKADTVVKVNAEAFES